MHTPFLASPLPVPLPGITVGSPDELVSKFAELILGSSSPEHLQEAAFYLAAAGGQLEAAINLYLDAQQPARRPRAAAAPAVSIADEDAELALALNISASESGGLLDPEVQQGLFDQQAKLAATAAAGSGAPTFGAPVPQQPTFGGGASVPSFSFGSTPVQPQPAFGGGASAPSFSFGSAAPVQPQPTFGGGASAPQFSFGGGIAAPVFGGTGGGSGGGSFFSAPAPPTQLPPRPPGGMDE